MTGGRNVGIVRARTRGAVVACIVGMTASSLVVSGTSAAELASAPVSAFEVASELALSADDVVDPFSLNSLPGSKRTIYLDFKGHDASDTFWPDALGVDEVSSAPFSIDGVEPEDLAIQIVEIWQEVAEDFAPFDVNVTTQDPGYDAINRSGPDDDTYGMRVAIGERTPAFPGEQVGIAYVGVFDFTVNHDRFQPAWVLPSTADNGRSITAAVATHEVGHTLGLRHVDGLGNDTWDPMMSSLYSGAPMIQWSRQSAKMTLQ